MGNTAKKNGWMMAGFFSAVRFHVAKPKKVLYTEAKDLDR